MAKDDPLLRYLEERDVLLKKITSLLMNDSRVVAAWLSGSLGRNQSDELSDLDVNVVAADDTIQEIVNHRRDFAAHIDPPVLFIEAPQNAPVSGGYLMALYDAPTAPHQVDWTWQPYSHAALPNESIMLFDRAGLPRSDQPQAYRGGAPDKEIVEQPIHFISFFWAILMITGKYVYRFPWAEEMEFLPMLVTEIRKTQAYLGREPGVEVGSHRDPAIKLQVLRRLAVQMEEMMPKVVERGSQVPTEIVPGAYRFLNLVEYGLTHH